MRLAEITEKSDKELENLVLEQRQALAKHLIDMRTKKVPNIKQTAAIKRIIAQSLTIKRQRELSVSEIKAPEKAGETNG